MLEAKYYYWDCVTLSNLMFRWQSIYAFYDLQHFSASINQCRHWGYIETSILTDLTELENEKSFLYFSLFAFLHSTCRYFINSTSRVSNFTVLYWALNWKIIPRIRLLIEPDINAISCIARLHFLQLQPVIETISHKKCIYTDRKWFQGYSPKLFYSTGCLNHDLIIFWS